MADEQHVWQESTSFFPVLDDLDGDTPAKLDAVSIYNGCDAMGDRVRIRFVLHDGRVPGRGPPPRMAGANQLAELNNLISAGASRARTTAESMSIARATRNPNVLTMTISPDAKPVDTRIRTNAALVIIWSDFSMPTATAWVLSPVVSYYSLTRLRRKTS